MNVDDDVICLSDSEPEELPANPQTSPTKTLLGGNVRAAPILKGLHINPSGQSTLAFDKRIRQNKRQEEFDEVELEHKAKKCRQQQQQSNIKSYFKSGQVKTTSSSDGQGMTISVKNSQSSTGGQTEVKIVVPTSASSFPVEMSRHKKTARKTMSSFTPKRIRPEVEVITLSDEEDESSVAKCSDNPSGIGQLQSSKVVPKTESKMKKPVHIKTEPKSETKDSDKGELSEAVRDFLSLCMSQLNAVEIQKVTSRFHKKIADLTPDPKTRRSLAKFVRQKHELFVEQPKNPFPCILEIFGQFDLHKIDKKRRIELVKVEKESKPETEETAPSSSKQMVDNSGSCTNLDKVLPDRRKQNIRKLETALMQCQQAIEKLEAEEMDLDDEEDSAYVRLDRYKRKFMAIFRRIAKLKEEDPSLGRRMDKKFRLGDVSRIPSVNIKIEKFINRKQKQKNDNEGTIGFVSSIFPDFADILKIFNTVNQEQNLGFSKEALLNEARETFKIVGERLKERRLQDDTEDLIAYIPKEQEDPADKNPELAEKLKESVALGQKKTAEIVEDFVKKQLESKPEVKSSNDEKKNIDSDEEDSVDENEAEEISLNEDSGDDNSANEDSGDEKSANEGSNDEKSDNEESEDEDSGDENSGDENNEDGGKSANESLNVASSANENKNSGLIGIVRNNEHSEDVHSSSNENSKVANSVTENGDSVKAGIEEN